MTTVRGYRSGLRGRAWARHVQHRLCPNRAPYALPDAEMGPGLRELTPDSNSRLCYASGLSGPYHQPRHSWLIGPYPVSLTENLGKFLEEDFKRTQTRLHFSFPSGEVERGRVKPKQKVHSSLCTAPSGQDVLKIQKNPNRPRLTQAPCLLHIPGPIKCPGCPSLVLTRPLAYSGAGESGPTHP